jgi:hypothetical protein
MVKTLLAAVACAAAIPATAQTASGQQPSREAQGSAQAPATTQAPAPGGSTAGTSSQQVVVNPPQGQPPPQPGSTTVVNPPPPPGPAVPVPAYPPDEVVVERRPRPNPLGTVATDAAFGGVAGLLVGVGVALVDQGNDWGRDVTVGAGAGVLVGAAVGVVEATLDARDYRERERVRRYGYGAPDLRVRPPATDGLDRTDKEPVITVRTVGLAFRF